MLIEVNDAAVQFTSGIGSLIGRTATEVYRDSPEIVADLSRCFLEKTPIKRSNMHQLRSTGETKLVDVIYCFVPPDRVVVYAWEVTREGKTSDAPQQAETEEPSKGEIEIPNTGRQSRENRQ